MESSKLSYYKSILRNKLRKTLRVLKASEKRKKSKEIVRRLLRRAEFKRSKKIVIYVAKSDEVQTREIIRKSLSLEKEVFAPRINLTKKRIDLFRIRNLSRDLKKGSYGILEPKPSKRRSARLSGESHRWATT